MRPTLARTAGLSCLALAALGLLGATPALAQTGPLSLPADSQQELDKAMAATWSVAVPELDAALLRAVKNLAGTQQGSLTIDTIDVASHDFTASPRVVVTPLAKNGAYSGENVRVDLPAQGSSWNLTIAGHVEYQIDVKVLFFHVKKHLSEDVSIEVTNLHASEDLDLDTATDPQRPTCTRTGNLQVDYKLKAHTSSFLLNVILFFAKGRIDKILRDHVDQALQTLDLQIAGARGLPGQPWGVGAPAHGTFGTTVDLEKLAVSVSGDIQAVHLPYGTLLAAEFDDPTFGQGNVVGYGGHGDSAIWTGHYLAGESFRSAVTGDPDAVTNAARVIAGITDLLDAEEPGGGHLSRCVIPMTDPSAAQQLATNPTVFATTLHGQPYIAHDHISRDQYLGVMHGLGCAYDFLQDPTQQQLAGSLITRVVDYLVAHDWVAMQHDGVSISAPFIQSPEKMIAFSALAAHVDPRFQAVRDEVAPLAYMSWVSEWLSFLDPLSGYYGWNLGNGARFHAMRLETDPGRFMALEREHEMERREIGHHENAYFQCVDCAVDPSLSTTLAPLVEDELQRWAARPRRQFSQQLSKDPTIEQAAYTAPLSFQKNAAGQGSVVAISQPEAKYPIPVERRNATDFLWQRDPFELDGGGDPHEQEPGADLVLPYWMGRFYNLVP